LVLSNLETRKEIMDTIAYNSDMSKEMMGILMNSKHGMILMMEKCKSDTAMMSTMCKTMMGNKEMTDMMEKMKKGNEDMKKMGNMHKMPGMDKKATK